MARTIYASVDVTSRLYQKVSIEWPDDLGEPTDENVLEALQNGSVYADVWDESGESDYKDVIVTDDGSEH